MLLSGGTALAAAPSATDAVKWKEGKAAPFAATRFDGATVNGMVYFLGFRAGDGTTTDGSIWMYDIKKDKYTDTKTDMPVPISNYTIAVLKDKTGTGLYTFGGRDNDGKIIDTVQVYYPSTGKASVIKSDPFPGKTPSKCTTLPGTGVAVAGNTAYVLGGSAFTTSVPPCAADEDSKQVWSFDPNGKSGKKWKAEPDLNVARGYITATVLGGQIYAIGGDKNEAGTLTAQDTVEAWKPGAKKWDDKGVADLAEPCDESQAFGYDSGPLAGTITLAGCGQWPNALPDVQTYTSKKAGADADGWKIDGALTEARRNHAGTDIGKGGKKSQPVLMVVGGYSADASAILMTSELGTAGKADGVSVVPPNSSVPAGKPSTF
jgi:hypothetical protein